jgi:hypothetical protein
MAQKTKTKRESTTEAEKSFGQMADKTQRSYEQAVRTGQRLQEEVTQWWTRMLSQTANAGDWQRQFSQFTEIAGNALPMAQRQMEGLMELMEHNGRAGAELMRKAIDAAQTPLISDSQTKWMDFMTSSLRAVRSNVEAVTEISTKAIDSWIQFIRKNTDYETRTARAG